MTHESIAIVKRVSRLLAGTVRRLPGASVFAWRFVIRFLTRPFRQDVGVALVYNGACTVSTLATALIAFCFGTEVRSLLGLHETLGDMAIFSGVVQIVAYVTFCAAYYPAMGWVKLRALRKMNGQLKVGDYVAVLVQCGVDFSIHFGAVDVPCHIIGGAIQTAVIWALSATVIVPLRWIDAVSTIVSQVLADFIFTPLEAPIWRFSGWFVRSIVDSICRVLPPTTAQWLKTSPVYTYGASTAHLSSLELSVTLDKAA